MNGSWFGIRVPDTESWTKLAEKFDSVKAQRQEVSLRVLGHNVEDPNWLIFDDLLNEEYDRMIKLLKLLDEKAG